MIRKINHEVTLYAFAMSAWLRDPSVNAICACPPRGVAHL